MLNQAFTFSVVSAVTLMAAIAGSASAQVIHYGPSGPIVVPSHANQHPVCPNCGRRHPPRNQITVTTPQFSGINQQTGGNNYRNQQINPSFYNSGRTSSLYNGTLRNEKRPVYDTSGRVIGYQRGKFWNDSFTGQEYGQSSVYTPNNQGGFNRTRILTSDKNNQPKRRKPNPT